MLVEALHDVSMAWDVWYYHLPFAARIAGIVPASQFAYDPLNQARFDGFPLLAEAIQGALWRLTGRAESANLVAFASVPLFAWFVKRRFDVPMYATILALLAVPAVQIHATSCYVDLPANAATSALVLLVVASYAETAAPSRGTIALALACAAIAANTKALSHPIVGLALVALAWRVRDWKTIAVASLALPLVFFTPLKNLALYQNPYYPVDLRMLGLHFHGLDEPYSSSPVWLEHAPRPVRFLCSVLEIGVRPMSDTRRWTVDEWTPPDAPGYRMGGFFGAYVALHLALFAWRAIRDRKDRAARAAAIGFAALTAVVSVLPQSHELRYYMSWMMVLVVLDLWLWRRSAPAVAPQRMALGALAALAVVIFVTRGAYAYPSGESFDQLVRAEVDPHALGKVHDGEHVCVHRAPWNLLWAARFHAPQSYAVTEADAPADCGGAPAL